MFQFILGFCLGSYFATYIDCKPTIELLHKHIKTNFPLKK